MGTPLSLSCVVVTKNRQESLMRLIRSIERQSRSPEALVVVNDGGIPFSLETPLPAKVLRNEQSVQSGRARNQGVSAAASEWVLILDDDVELVNDDFLEKALSVAPPSEVALIFPRKLDCLGEETREFSFVVENPLTGELRDVSTERMLGRLQEGQSALGPMVCFIRRKVYLALGGYDSIFGWGRGHSFREESDFQLRLQGSGHLAALLPELFIRHHVQKAGGHGPNDHRKLFWVAHNQVVFAARHHRFWLLQIPFFALLELPRYAWGNGRLITYPAGLLGLAAGFLSVLVDRVKFFQPTWMRSRTARIQR